MVIGAHPDDELLGAGGTLARHVLAGDEVHAVVVADGAGSRYPAELASVLEKQARGPRRSSASPRFSSSRCPTSGLTPCR